MLVVKSKIVNVKNNYKIISIEYSKPFTINFVGSLLTTYAMVLIIFGALTLSTFLQNLSNNVSTFTFCDSIYNKLWLYYYILCHLMIKQKSIGKSTMLKIKKRLKPELKRIMMVNGKWRITRFDITQTNNTEWSVYFTVENTNRAY
jgi:hypothetical protein